MRRRTFIAVLAVRPRGRWRRGDSSRCERSGFSAAGPAVDSALRVEAFRQTLSEAGYIEGQDATIDY